MTFSKIPRRLLCCLLALLLPLAGLGGCGPAEAGEPVADLFFAVPEAEPSLEGGAPVYGEACNAPEDVAAYLYVYGELPPNYLTKDEARQLGWQSGARSLWDAAPGMSIGGDRFGNYEGRLPDRAGRIWYECDVNYSGGDRGAERLVYSSDGLIYYTADHYETFTLLYGEE